MKTNAYGVKLYVTPIRYDETPPGDLYTEVFAADLADALKMILSNMKIGNYSAIIIRRKA